jgi:hypothetical protein
MHVVLKALAFYKCNVVMCQTLLRSADHSVPHKHILLTKEQSLLLSVELGFDDKHFFNDPRCSSVYRKEWQGFITSHCTGQDVVCCYQWPPVGMYHLLHGFLSVVF